VAASALKCKPELDNNVKNQVPFRFSDVNNSIESLLSGLYHAFILPIFLTGIQFFSYFKNNGFIFRNRNISGSKSIEKMQIIPIPKKHKTEKIRFRFMEVVIFKKSDG
jgi:hypothetical protein